MSVESHGPTVTNSLRAAASELVGVGRHSWSGSWNGRVLVGTAYVFGCGPIPYTVSGAPDLTGVLVLRGLAPVVAIWPFCGVIGWDWTKNSMLVFYPQ